MVFGLAFSPPVMNPSPYPPATPPHVILDVRRRHGHHFLGVALLPQERVPMPRRENGLVICSYDAIRFAEQVCNPFPQHLNADSALSCLLRGPRRGHVAFPGYAALTRRLRARSSPRPVVALERGHVPVNKNFFQSLFRFARSAALFSGTPLRAAIDPSRLAAARGTWHASS